MRVPPAYRQERFFRWNREHISAQCRGGTPVPQELQSRGAAGSYQRISPNPQRYILKNADKPEFSVNVFWEKYPFKQIEMLKDVMEIPEEEIINWYLDNIEIADVIDAIKEGIKEKILFEVGKDLQVKIETATSGYISDLESEVKDTYGVSTYNQTCYVVDTPPKIEKPKSDM